MKSLVEQGMKDGAFGFSTGLTYVPGTYSDTNELTEICKSLRAYGGTYITHCRYHRGDGLLDPFREAIDIGAEAGVSVQISHFHSPLDGMGERNDRTHQTRAATGAWTSHSTSTPIPLPAPYYYPWSLPGSTQAGPPVLWPESTIPASANRSPTASTPNGAAT